MKPDPKICMFRAKTSVKIVKFNLSFTTFSAAVTLFACFMIKNKESSFEFIVTV